MQHINHHLFSHSTYNTSMDFDPDVNSNFHSWPVDCSSRMRSELKWPAFCLVMLDPTWVARVGSLAWILLSATLTLLLLCDLYQELIRSGWENVKAIIRTSTGVGRRCRAFHDSATWLRCRQCGPGIIPFLWDPRFFLNRHMLLLFPESVVPRQESMLLSPPPYIRHPDSPHSPQHSPTNTY